MACNCTGAEQGCIKAYVGPCDTAIATGLIAPADGDYLVLLEGGSAAISRVYTLEENDELFLINDINNSFVYQMQVFQPDGELLNDTCYSLRTIVTMQGGTSVNPTPTVETRPCTIQVIIVDDPDPSVLYTTCNGKKIRYEYAPGDTLQILSESGDPYLPGLYIQRPVFLADGPYQTMPYNSTLGTFDNSANNGFQASGDPDNPTVFTVNYAQPI